MWPLLLLGLLLGFGVWGLLHIARLEENSAKDRAIRLADDTAAWLHAQVLAAAIPVQLLAALVGARLPYYASARDVFLTVAPVLLQQAPYSASQVVQLQPGGVIAEVVPLTGNEGLIGLDVFAASLAGNRDGALKAVEDHSMTLVGPMVPVQGGRSLVVRMPLFLSNLTAATNGTSAPGGVGEAAVSPPLNPNCGEPCAFDPKTGTIFWGFISSVVGLDELLHAQAGARAGASSGGAPGGGVARLDSLEALGYRYRVEALGIAAEELRVVAASSPPPKDPVEVLAVLPNAEWSVQLSPAHGGGWRPSYFGGLLAAVAVAALAVAALLLAALVSRQKHLLLLEALVPPELLPELQQAAPLMVKQAAERQRERTMLDTPADLLLALLGDLLEGRPPAVCDLLLIRSALLGQKDIYTPLNVMGRINDAITDTDVAQSLMRQLGGQQPPRQHPDASSFRNTGDGYSIGDGTALIRTASYAALQQYDMGTVAGSVAFILSAGASAPGPAAVGHVALPISRVAGSIWADPEQPPPQPPRCQRSLRTSNTNTTVIAGTALGKKSSNKGMKRNSSSTRVDELIALNAARNSGTDANGAGPINSSILVSTSMVDDFSAPFSAGISTGSKPATATASSATVPLPLSQPPPPMLPLPPADAGRANPAPAPAPAKMDDDGDNATTSASLSLLPLPPSVCCAGADGDTGAGAGLLGVSGANAGSGAHSRGDNTDKSPATADSRARALTAPTRPPPRGSTVLSVVLPALGGPPGRRLTWRPPSDSAALWVTDGAPSPAPLCTASSLAPPVSRVPGPMPATANAAAQVLLAARGTGVGVGPGGALLHGGGGSAAGGSSTDATAVAAAATGSATATTNIFTTVTASARPTAEHGSGHLSGSGSDDEDGLGGLALPLRINRLSGGRPPAPVVARRAPPAPRPQALSLPLSPPPLQPTVLATRRQESASARPETGPSSLHLDTSGGPAPSQQSAAAAAHRPSPRRITSFINLAGRLTGAAQGGRVLKEPGARMSRSVALSVHSSADAHEDAATEVETLEEALETSRTVGAVPAGGLVGGAHEGYTPGYAAVKRAASVTGTIARLLSVDVGGRLTQQDAGGVGCSGGGGVPSLSLLFRPGRSRLRNSAAMHLPGEAGAAIEPSDPLSVSDLSAVHPTAARVREASVTVSTVASPRVLVPVEFGEVERLLDAAHRGWQYDIWALQDATQGHALSVLGYHLIQREGLISKFGLSAVRLARLLRRVEEGYLGNPYHSAVHAADVLQTLHVILHGAQLNVHYLDPLGLLAAYLAAIVHDYAHPGLTGDFLIATSHPLALRYNDRSPLENHHCAAAFELLSAHTDLDVLAPLSATERAALRKQVIELVLATDMKQHFSTLTHFNTVHRLQSSKGFQGQNSSKGGGGLIKSAPGGRLANVQFEIEGSDAVAAGPESAPCAPQPLDDSERLLSLQVALKVADLGHLAEEMDVHQRWLSALEEEFFRQGDQERQLGLPISPLFDREKQGVSKSQVGFFEFVALPLANALVSVFPGAQPMMECLTTNYRHWRRVAREAAAATAAAAAAVRASNTATGAAAAGESTAAAGGDGKSQARQQPPPQPLTAGAAATKAD